MLASDDERRRGSDRLNDILQKNEVKHMGDNRITHCRKALADAGKNFVDFQMRNYMYTIYMLSKGNPKDP